MTAAEVRAAAERAYEAALAYAAGSRSPWAQQLVDDAGRLLGTIKWVEGDEERRRIDAEKLKEERHGE